MRPCDARERCAAFSEAVILETLIVCCVHTLVASMYEVGQLFLTSIHPFCPLIVVIFSGYFFNTILLLDRKSVV